MFPTLTTSRFHSAWSDPFATMRREFQRNLEAFENGADRLRTVSAPVALWEDDQRVYLEVDVPGLQKGDLDVTIEDGRLWIRGERKMPEHCQRSWYDERHYGRFERVISLSNMVDPESIDATLEDGVLYLTLIKKPEAQSHRIAINTRNGKQKRLASEESASKT